MKPWKRPNGQTARLTLYQFLQAHDVDHHHHESDLYVPADELTASLIEEWQDANGCRVACSEFWNAVDGGLWLDLAFQYDPFWQDRRTA